MAIEQIDGIDAETLQRSLAALDAICWRAIDVDNRTPALVEAPELERILRGEEDIAPSLRVQLEPLAHEVLAVPVGTRAVPEYFAELPSSIEDLEPFLVRAVAQKRENTVSF